MTDIYDGVYVKVFPDIVSVDLATRVSSGQSPPGQKKHNRGFAFVKFSSHAVSF